MTEPTIAYTLFALLLASSACLLIGTVVGWCAQSYKNRGILEDNEAKLRSNQQEMAEMRIHEIQAAKARAAQSKVQENGGETIHRLSGINDQKTALIKKLMEKQLVLQKQRQHQAKRIQAAAEQLKKQRTATQLWRKKVNELTEANSSEENKQVATRHVEAEAARALKTSDPVAPASNEKTEIKNPEVLKNAKDLTPTTPVQAQSVKIDKVSKADKVPASPTVVATMATAVKAKAAPEKKKNSPATKVSNIKNDLTRIKGIGPAIEVALNDVGIMNVEQLANLTPLRVNELDKQLGRYGRISRLNWVGAAKKLVNKKKKLAAA